MSKRIADLIIKLGADSYEFQQKVKEVDKSLGKLTKRLDSLGKELSLKLTAPIVALGVLSLKAFDDSAKSMAKVEQAIKSTGGAAKLSSAQLGKFASELQSKTLFEDDFILNNSTAQLLTFTNIAGENFKRTQAVALDLATVLDGDLKSASIQLGKALNDPVKNLTALSRAGIQFSKEQVATIKNLAETNRLAQAQGVILSELEKQYGGQAQAAAKVGLGALTQLKNNWGDFLEQIGAIMMPLINKIVGVLSVVVSWLQKVNPKVLEMTVVVGGLAAAIGPLLLSIGSVIKLLPVMAVAITALLSPIGLVVTALVAIGAAFALAKIQKDEFFDSRVTKLVDEHTLEELNGKLKRNFERLSNIEAKLKDRTAKFGNDGAALKKHYEDKPDLRSNAPFAARNLRTEYKRDVFIHNDLMNDIREEIKQTEEAIKIKNKEIEETKKYEAEIRRISAISAAAFKDVNTEITRTPGLINNITNEIEALEKKKLLPTSTIADIAKANDEITVLKKKLSELQDVSLKQITTKQTTSTPNGAGSIVPTIDIKVPDLSNVMSKVHEQILSIKNAVKDGIFDWADGIDTKLQGSISKVEGIVSNYTSALVNKGWEFNAALGFVTDQVATTIASLDQTLNNFISGTIVSAAESIGGIIAGDLGFGDLLNGIATQMAQFLKQIGVQLIEFGVQMLALKLALKSVLSNPYVAIAIGAAMVAVSKIMTSSIKKNAAKNIPKLANGGLAYGATYAMVGDNPNASVDPEVIAPLSKLKGIMAQGGNQNVSIHLTGELKAKGRDLVYVIGKENFKLGILGG